MNEIQTAETMIEAMCRYRDWTATTMTGDTRTTRFVLGLNGEIGEVNEQRMIEHDHECADEYGDVAWYIFALASEHDVDVGDWEPTYDRYGGWMSLDMAADRLAEAYKKQLRDDTTVDWAERLRRVWLSWLATVENMGYDPQSVLAHNVDKLTDRATRGVIRGSGDDR